MRRRKKTKSGLGIVAFVVLILCGVVSYSRIGLAHEKAEAERTLESINKDIDKENSRKDEIKDKKEYTKTRQYIEDIARKQLGLVYKDEIIFQPKD